VQFAIRAAWIYVLDVNRRPSRTVPFVSKATGLELGQGGIGAGVIDRGGKGSGAGGSRDSAVPAVFLRFLKEGGVPGDQVPRSEPDLVRGKLKVDR